MSSDYAPSAINDLRFAAITPRVTGGISALSSVLIIIIILRSPTKLTTIYHRIIFLMSCSDILMSVAAGITSLAMPRDMDDLVGNEFGVGTRLGNVQTCEAQGFFYIFGLAVMLAYNGSLWTYYTCAIAFRLKEKSIVKCIEPVLHIVPLSMGLGWAVPPLIHKLYHPKLNAWCSIDVDLDRNAKNPAEGENMMNLLVTLWVVHILFFIVWVCTCFALIFWRVFQTERQLYGPKRIVRQSRMAMERVERSHRNTKILLYQALAYFLSYMVSLSPSLVHALLGHALTNESLWALRLSFVLIPFQGFFNALIFISHKVSNYRRAHEDVSRCSVFILLIKGSVADPVLLSRISMLKTDENRRKVLIELANEMSTDSLYECDLDIPASSDGVLAHAGDSINNRDNLSDFSTSMGDVEDGKERADVSSRDGLSGFSSILSPELESQFVDDLSVVPSIEEDEALSYSKTGSILSSLKGIHRSGASSADLDSFC